MDFGSGFVDAVFGRNTTLGGGIKIRPFLCRTNRRLTICLQSTFRAGTLVYEVVGDAYWWIKSFLGVKARL